MPNPLEMMEAAQIAVFNHLNDLKIADYNQSVANDAINNPRYAALGLPLQTAQPPMLYVVDPAAVHAAFLAYNDANLKQLGAPQMAIIPLDLSKAIQFVPYAPPAPAAPPVIAHPAIPGKLNPFNNGTRNADPLDVSPPGTPWTNPADGVTWVKIGQAEGGFGMEYWWEPKP